MKHIKQLNYPSKHCASEISIYDLKRENQLTDEQLDTEVKEDDLLELAACFDNTYEYVRKLGLNPGQQNDVVRTEMVQNSTKAGMTVALELWRKRNPMAAVFRALLNILLSLAKVDVAVRVCNYLSDKCKDVHNLA